MHIYLGAYLTVKMLGVLIESLIAFMVSVSYTNTRTHLDSLNTFGILL